jgi:hypothetical protein
VDALSGARPRRSRCSRSTRRGSHRRRPRCRWGGQPLSSAPLGHARAAPTTSTAGGGHTLARHGPLSAFIEGSRGHQLEPAAAASSARHRPSARSSFRSRSGRGRGGRYVVDMSTTQTRRSPTPSARRLEITAPRGHHERHPGWKSNIRQEMSFRGRWSSTTNSPIESGTPRAAARVASPPCLPRTGSGASCTTARARPGSGDATSRGAS